MVATASLGAGLLPRRASSIRWTRAERTTPLSCQKRITSRHTSILSSSAHPRLLVSCIGGRDPFGAAEVSRCAPSPIVADVRQRRSYLPYVSVVRCPFPTQKRRRSAPSFIGKRRAVVVSAAEGVDMEVGGSGAEAASSLPREDATHNHGAPSRLRNVALGCCVVVAWLAAMWVLSYFESPSRAVLPGRFTPIAESAKQQAFRWLPMWPNPNVVLGPHSWTLPAIASYLHTVIHSCTAQESRRVIIFGMLAASVVRLAYTTRKKVFRVSSQVLASIFTKVASKLTGLEITAKSLELHPFGIVFRGLLIKANGERLTWSGLKYLTLNDRMAIQTLLIRGQLPTLVRFVWNIVFPRVRTGDSTKHSNQENNNKMGSTSNNDTNNKKSNNDTNSKTNNNSNNDTNGKTNSNRKRDNLPSIELPVVHLHGAVFHCSVEIVWAVVSWARRLSPEVRISRLQLTQLRMFIDGPPPTASGDLPLHTQGMFVQAARQARWVLEGGGGGESPAQRYTQSAQRYTQSQKFEPFGQNKSPSIRSSQERTQQSISLRVLAMDQIRSTMSGPDFVVAMCAFVAGTGPVSEGEGARLVDLEKGSNLKNPFVGPPAPAQAPRKPPPQALIKSLPQRDTNPVIQVADAVAQVEGLLTKEVQYQLRSRGLDSWAEMTGGGPSVARETAKWLARGVRVTEYFQSEAVEKGLPLELRIANLLQSLEPGLLSQALQQDLPRRIMAQDPTLIEGLLDNGVIVRALEDEPLFRGLLEGGLMRIMLDRGAFQLLAPRPGLIKTLIVTGSLKELLKSGLVMDMFQRGDPVVLEAVLKGNGFMEAMVETSLLQGLLQQQQE